MNELIDPYQEEEDAQPFEKRYGDKLVDVGTLTSVVKKIRHAYDARYKELEDLYEAKYKALRKDMMESKSLALEAAAATPSSGSNVLSAGLMQVSKDMEQMDKAWSSWQTSQSNKSDSLGREVKHLKEKCKNLSQALNQAHATNKSLHDRVSILEGYCSSFPQMLKNLLGNLPVPQVTVPNKALQVNVAPAEIAVQLPVRHTVKKFQYMEDGRPESITEEESDAPLRDLLTPEE
jgi:hypothetical protein